MSADLGEIVPFGKYKGRPLVDLIADRSYTDWLAAQPWFRQRYGTVYNLVVNTGTEPQDTPEHNAMQARFLEHDEVLRVGRLMFRDWNEEPIGERTDLKIEIRRLAFESGGWDVFASVSAIPVGQLAGGGQLHLGVELKPVIGDDYPSILREVLKRARDGSVRGYQLNAIAVLADKVTVTSVDYEKVQKIFRTQRVRLLRTADLPELPPEWRCVCSDCA